MSVTTHEQRAARLADIPAERAAWTTELRERQQLLAAYRARVANFGHPKNGFEARELEELKRLAVLVEHGATVSTAIPVDNPEIAALVGRPSIAALEAKLRALVEEEAAVRAELERWPTADALRQYRYTGGGKHFENGRLLAVGEEVQLTRERAAKLADRFAPVDAG